MAPNGKLHKVEILGDGQQIVVNGIHPDTHKPYRWHGGEPGPKLRREDLPLITAETAAAFLAAAAEIDEEPRLDGSPKQAVNRRR